MLGGLRCCWRPEPAVTGNPEPPATLPSPAQIGAIGKGPVSFNSTT